MNSPGDAELQARIQRALDSMSPSSGFVERVRGTLRDRAADRRPRRVRRMLAGALLGGTVAAGLAIALSLGLGLRGHQQISHSKSLNGEVPPAAIATGAGDRFVWLTYHLTRPAVSPAQGEQVVGTGVDVLDWTGAVRYQFELPASSAGQLQAISADGTRALLPDGSIIDQTGATRGRIPTLANVRLAHNGVRWMPDSSAICAAESNQPLGQTSSPVPTTKGSAPQPTSLPPFALPGADHSVTLKVYVLNGEAQSIATVGGGSLDEPSGIFPDSTSVLSCNRSTDVAVIARYHDATDPSGAPERTPDDITASLWAIRLSTGDVLFHQPETRIATGRPYFFGSQNGALAVEFLWNSAVAGSEVDKVIHIPSGLTVPVLEPEPIPDTPALSADGSRILRRVVDTQRNVTIVKLIDASDGHVIRRFEFSRIQAMTAVADPGGTGFMAVVDGKLLLLDKSGGTTVLQTPLELTGMNAFSVPEPPDLQG